MFDKMNVWLLGSIILLSFVLMYFVGNIFFLLATAGRYFWMLVAMAAYMGVIIFVCSTCGAAWNRLKKRYPFLGMIKES